MNVKRLGLFLLAGLLYGMIALSVSATVLTFDDIPLSPSYGIGPIPGGYGGFTWGNVYVINPSSPPYSGDPTVPPGVVSGQSAAATWGAYINIYPVADFFDFNGAWITMGHGGAGPAYITLTGWYGSNGGNEVGHVSMFLNENTPTWYACDFQHINRLTITNNYLPLFDVGALMDDFTFNESIPSSPVPEPTTMLLFGTGIVGLVAARRRKKVG